MATKKRSGRPASKRQLRVGEQLRHIISSILTEDNMHDPDVTSVSITVTEVQPSQDMRNATVYVLPLGGENEKAVIDGLNRSSGFIQAELGKQLTMKFTPRLVFKKDNSFEYGDHIDALIRRNQTDVDDLDGDDTDNSE
ncbi:ribosome-binding factor A [Alphaproteobacteria bacterium 46_93_T64]|nr:ribosome-binding factor A [Alphaproteobacteria bacterium 46_93_T64]